MAVEAGGIGARLRAGREKLGLTVLQVAERIHTDPKIVEAIEAENYEALGAPVYARGHIGHYAELVGESGSELNQLYSHQSKVAQPDLTRIVKAPAGTNSSKLVAPALLVIAVFAVGAAATLRRDDLMRPNELDYVVDGTVRTRGNIHHIKVRLLDLTSCASPIWTNEFALAATEPYCVNEVTARIVARIDPVVLFIEGKRRERHGATGLLLRAIPLMYTMKRREYEEAGDFIMRALEEDPDNAKVAAWAAHWQVFHVGQGWAQDPRQALATAQRFALKAIAIDPKNAEALGIYAHICSFMNKDFDAALYFFDRSLRLNPNLGFVWALSAVTQCYVGEPDAALARMDRYRELAPYDPYFSFFEGVYAIAYLLKNQYKRAAGVGRRLVKGHPEFSNGYKPLIAALGHLKQFDEAKPYVAKLIELEPQFSVSHFGKTYPFRRDSDRERYMEGLRLAGVPEQ